MHFPDDACGFAVRLQGGEDGVRFACRGDEDEADAHVEGAVAFFPLDVLQDGVHERQGGEGGGIDHGGEAFAVGARQVFRQATAGDVGKAMHAVFAEDVKDGFDVDFGRGEQVFADGFAIMRGVEVGEDFAQQ